MRLPHDSGPRGENWASLGSGDHRTFRTEIPIVVGKQGPGHLSGRNSMRVLKCFSGEEC